MELEPLHPEEAVSLYLQERRGELTQATLQPHEYRLGHLLRWAEEKGIANVNKLTGRRIQSFSLWRREQGDSTPVSLKTRMDTVRVFIASVSA